MLTGAARRWGLLLYRKQLFGHLFTCSKSYIFEFVFLGPSAIQVISDVSSLCLQVGMNSRSLHFFNRHTLLYRQSAAVLEFRCEVDQAVFQA